jgi:hypothetical protein
MAAMSGFGIVACVDKRYFASIRTRLCAIELSAQTRAIPQEKTP